MYTKKNLPEKDEMVICTIRDANPSSVFAILDEYEKVEGMIHVSEIARKQVRAMKVYLKPGTKLVCKVMSMDLQKRYAELSLRRVGEGQRRTKLQQWGNEKIANDILEVFAKQVGLASKAAYEKVGNKIIEAYGALYPGFIEISQKGVSVLNKIEVESKLAEQLATLIQKRITPPKAEIEGYFILQSSAANGIDVIKNAVAKAQELAEKSQAEIEIKYISAPKYKFKLESTNKKALDETLKSIQAELNKYMAANSGTFLTQ
ncbi:MAG: S1 RNA-binding domain-containing protein [DPANN group archaeon]|nr:S1 RNA-binding domain-containing protein [DPANN group archaeon]